MKYVVAGICCVLALVVVLSLCFGLEWLGIKWHGFFAVKREAVRREVFLETRSYNEAKLQELVKYRLEYMRGDDADKEAIAATVRLAFSEFDESKLKPELADFLRTCKYGKAEKQW